MKKIIVPLIAVVIAVMMGLSACERAPENDGKGNDTGTSTIKAVMQAYNRGKKYYEETATSYETIYQGVAKPSGIGGAIAGEQKVYTRRYLSQNGDFIYDTANYSGGSIDVSFSLLIASPGGQGDYYYKKIDGKKHLRQENGMLFADYSEQQLSTFETASAAGFVDTCGFAPRELLNYIITEDTVSSVEEYKLGEDGDEFAVSFKIKMRSSAHTNYQKQVEFCSGHSYSSFTSLMIEVGIDAEGRIVQVTTTEEYSVKAGIKQKMKVEGTQYINYDKNPSINFDDFSINFE